VVEFYSRWSGAPRPSPMHKLNRAGLAVAEWKGPAAGLEVSDGFEPPTWWFRPTYGKRRRYWPIASALRKMAESCETAIGS